MYLAVQINNTSYTALIDCGASGYAYVSQKVATDLQLPLTTLSQSITLRGFEGIDSAHQITSFT